jgi:hypothetical protein
MNDLLHSRAAAVTRTVIALIVLLVFWGAIGYTLWPELVPGLLRTVQSVRGIGAEEAESRYLDVRNNSDASDAQVRGVIRTLEIDYEAVLEFLGRSPGDPIPVLITNGYGPAMADGLRLNIFYDNGVLNLDTAPFFLVFLSQGEEFGFDTDFFLKGGFAIYVAEEVGRAQGFTGQPADAWVELLRQKGALLPLAEAWEAELPQSEEGLFDFLRALIESGSFVRWLVEGYGIEAVQELRDGLSLENVTEMSLAEAEEAWLASVTSQDLQPKPCRLALPGGSLLGALCEQLDEATR